MTPILCVSKADMPAMMYELGKLSNVDLFYAGAIAFIIAIIILSALTIRQIIFGKPKEIKGLVLSIFNALCIIIMIVCAENANKTKEVNDFQNFAYNQPSKFILQYYTVTTSKQYKFIAETNNNVFIKEIVK